MIKKADKRTLVLGCLSLLMPLVIFIAYFFGIFNSLQDQLTDRFFVPEQPSKEIIIIDIDEESLAAVGRWPWDRQTHGQLLENLEGARVVGFDIIFSEPSEKPGDDDLFAQAIKNFEGQVVLPQVISQQSNQVTDPVLALKEVSERGFVNTSPDRDGVVRFAQVGVPSVNSFDSILSGTPFCLEALCAPEIIRIDYKGPAQTYTTLSYVDVLGGKVPVKLFKDKTVLVGASASGLGDSYQTPFGTMPGVEIHANSIETLQSNRFIHSISSASSFIMFVFIGVLTFLLVTRVRNMYYLTAAIFGVFILIIFASYAGFSFLLIIPHLYGLILFILLVGSLLLAQYIYETREKKFIRDGFEHYVDPDVVKELYEHPEKLSLGGESKTLSILFSDIRDFTSISEKLTPEQLMDQLNEYLEEMAGDIIENKGLVDKYIGDAVMAFWGAPLLDKDHAMDACQSAISMISSLEKLNRKWMAENKPLFKIGIGISTGDVIVGNMGSKQRFNYSIIGDEVNFASRIEGLTKEYGVECIIGSGTYDLIKDESQFLTRELDDVMVKGKEEPRKIYELLIGQDSKEKQKCLEHFKSGRKNYIQGDFDAAIKSFKAALSSDPSDGPSQVFLERCIILSQTPPSDWTGVFEFKSK